MENYKRRLLTVKEAAEEIDGLTVYRVRQMCANGQLPHIMAGRKILIAEEVLIRTLFEVDINKKETQN